MARIAKKNYYILENRHKNSRGEWLKTTELSIVTGHKAVCERAYVLKQLDVSDIRYNNGCQAYELEDGHIRGYRPVTTSLKTVLDFLDANRFSRAYIVN